MAKKKEPKYIMSALNTPMLNYKTYVMEWQEKVLNYLLMFVGGGAIGLIFYGGQFLDENGATTKATTICNAIIFVVVGLVACRIFMPMRCKSLQSKRRSQLSQQFRSLLDTLAVSLSSGMNMSEAIESAYEDLKTQYSEKAYIVVEIGEMVKGIENNIPIEDMMVSLGERSQIDDIKNFGIVFETCYRAGGNMKDIMRRTNSIIGEKIGISAEIETAIESNKAQFWVMMVMPIAIILMLRTMSSAFAASFATVPGVIAMTVAAAIFVGAYIWGQSIMDVKG